MEDTGVTFQGRWLEYQGRKYAPYNNLDTTKTALESLDKKQKITLGLSAGVITLALLFFFHITVVAILTLVTLAYFLDIFFNLYLIYNSFRKKPDIQVSQQEISSVADDFWPTYSIFCPLYKELEVLPQFIR